MLFRKKPKPTKSDGEGADEGGGVDSSGRDLDAEAQETEGEGAKPRFTRKTMIIAAAAAVLVLGGGGTGAFLLLKPDGASDSGHAPAKKKSGHGPATKNGKADPELGEVKGGPDGVTFYTMPDLIVNIQTADGRPTFLKLKLTFEVEDPTVADRMMADAPRLKDMFQTFLRELRPEDLAGSQGSYQLRMEILRRVNLIVAPDQVEAVLIEEMLIQ